MCYILFVYCYCFVDFLMLLVVCLRMFVLMVFVLALWCGF